MAKCMTTPEEQFRMWYEHYMNMDEMDSALNMIALIEDVNVTELWLGVVAQEML